MPTSTRIGWIVAAMGLMVSTGAAAAAPPPGKSSWLAPHRAVYDIVLAHSRGGSGVSDMSGRMVYELSGSACDGYTQTMRFVTRTTNQEGATSLTDMRSSSWEDAGAKTFRFNSSQYKESKLSDTTAGEAKRTSPTVEGLMALSKPEPKEVRIGSGTFFPIQHSIALLAAARKGERLFIGDLYDGSEKGEKVYATTSFLGARRAPGYNKSLPEVAGAEVLNGMPSWPVSISYFEPGSESKDAAPVYELAFLYFDNGVSRRLYIDYGDFALRGTLSALTFLEEKKCDAKP